MGVVYLLQFPNGKGYIGWTKGTVAQRYKAHIQNAKNGSTYAVHRAIRKYGLKNVVVEVLVSDVSETAARMLEIDYIACLGMRVPNGYNLTEGGEGVLGCAFSPEARQKLSVARRNRGPISEETRLKMSNASRGRRPFLGRSHSEETRHSMSKGLKYRWTDSDYQKKMSDMMKGNKHLLGYRFSDASKQKMRESRYRHLAKCRKEQDMVLSS